MAASKLSMEDSQPEYLNGNHHEELRRIRTAGTVSISAELFEKLYLSPQNVVKGDLRTTFGNPTPIALVGFLIALTPLSCDLMGWRGAGGNGAAGIGTYYFFGGLLQLLGGFLEWVLGNTFPSVVFCTFGAFFLSFAATLSPSFAAFSTYAPVGEDGSAGLATQGFNASFGFFTLWIAILCIVFLICSFRVNICFVIIFFTLSLAFFLLTATYWLLAADYEGNAATAGKILKAAGASCFVTCAFGWWVFLAIMIAVVDLPFAIPVGDLSTFIKSASARKGEV
ncbi:gpr1-like plasma membrane protein [Coniochaeta ligniaria NRRL 30616]|uniref:Gpr1-like plasma membrane protein n=1 Tax=Coniochaeta ligniaria NRRL 30616 TaxID=1408157 RepID=A0A1J7I5Z9_9PEZI|nr:gpr1-like plasma membrane protein [Coniochaeta ligniaria NRRL 30616]